MNALLVPCLAAAFLAAGCADTERSREVGNPQVAATTLARQVCSNCHGVRGDSPSPNFPKLAGQPASYLAAQLRDFRDQRRTDLAGRQYMWGLTRHLSDEQIDGLAGYYAMQAPSSNGGGGAAATDADAGRQLYEQGAAARQVVACASCHGQHGEGLAANPRLAGQHREYLATQLKVFRDGGRKTGDEVMAGIARQLSAQQIVEVAAYASSLDPGLHAQAAQAGE